MPSTVVTANRLGDGSVVFMTAGGEWVLSLREAAVFPEGGDADALQRAKHAEERQIIVDSYPVEVIERDGVPVPKSLREIIRANGPSVRPNLKAVGT